MILLILSARQTHVSTQQREGSCWDSTQLVIQDPSVQSLARQKEGSWICKTCSYSGVEKYRGLFLRRQGW